MIKYLVLAEVYLQPWRVCGYLLLHKLCSQMLQFEATLCAAVLMAELLNIESMHLPAMCDVSLLQQAT